MPDRWDSKRAMKQYIATLPGSNFWTPARVTGAAMMVNPGVTPTATLLAAPKPQPRMLQHLPVPQAEQPHDEASAARYGARWYREHEADARRDAGEQNRADQERLRAEEERTRAESSYKKNTESIDSFRKFIEKERK